jgi:hypothetical protein
MPEIKKTKRETIAQLAEKFPGVATFEVAYQGAGDNFDSFFDFIMKDSAGNEIESSQTDEDSFLTIADDYIWHIFDKAQSQPDFNNDGSEGKVIFDMINKVVILEVTYLEDVTPDYDGDEDDEDYDEKRDEYWDNMDERDWEYHVQKPEEF